MISCYHYKVNPLRGLCGREVFNPDIVSRVVNLIFAELHQKAHVRIAEEMKVCVHNHVFYTHTRIYTEVEKKEGTKCK